MNNDYELFIGIDPGWSGSITCLTPDGEIFMIDKMPETGKEIFEFFKQFEGVKAKVIMEKLWGRPGMGGTVMFTFGRNYEALTLSLDVLGFDFEEITPQEWIKHFGWQKDKKYNKFTRTEWKNFLKQKAQELFPNKKVTLTLADSLLIASYCRNLYK